MDFPIRFAAATFIAVGTSVSPALAKHDASIVAATAKQPMQFDSESVAQERCPNDTVVWLNTNTGIYHHLSVRRYGRTHRGGYVCKPEADADGAREAQGKDR
jgi:hypothetical protein